MSEREQDAARFHSMPSAAHPNQHEAWERRQKKMTSTATSIIAIDSVKEIPTHLKHKPIMACNYSDINSEHGGSDGGDAKYISVGHAQYDNDSVSVKVMRHTGNQWSPQSEEVPIQRVPYMMALLLAAIYKAQNPDCKCPISHGLGDAMVEPEGVDFLRSAIEEWGDYLKEGIECVKDLLERIDTSKIGR